MLSSFVGGEWLETASGETDEIVNPADESVLGEVPSASAADVDRAVAAAVEAFPAWAQTPPAKRAGTVLALADLLEEHVQELARLESLNVGKPLAGAVEEMEFTADCLRFIAGAARMLEGQAAGEYVEGHTSIIRRDPIGACGQITPWNYPLHIALVKSCQAIAAGNTVVAKPSELTPLTLLRFMEIAGDALPPGVLNVVTGGGSPTGEAIVAHPDVRAIGFTGDVSTGRAIAERAAAFVKRLSLELGGKSPVIVFADADLTAVAEALKIGSFANSGQDCQAASRVLVQADVYDDLLAELVPRVEAMKMGDPAESEDLDLGPVISARQQERVLGFVERAAEGGATIVCGGEAGQSPGFFVLPTVVGDVHQDAEITQREVFGPVVTLQRFSDEDEALRAANGTQYGLSSSVWTADIGRAMRMSGRMQFGTVWVNAHFVSTPEMPHGGFKQSGYGKDYSKYGVEEYTVVKHVTLSHQRP